MGLKEVRKIIRDIKEMGSGLQTSGARLKGVLHDEFVDYITRYGAEFQEIAYQLDKFVKELEKNKG